MLTKQSIIIIVLSLISYKLSLLCYTLFSIPMFPVMSALFGQSFIPTISEEIMISNEEERKISIERKREKIDR